MLQISSNSNTSLPLPHLSSLPFLRGNKGGKALFLICVHIGTLIIGLILMLADLVLSCYAEVVYLPRGEALGGDTVPKMAVFQDSLKRMEEMRGFHYDYLMDLDITSPLRTLADMNNAYDKEASRDDLDLVFSVTDSRRNPYFNMVANCGDHVEKVIASPYTARQQAPEIYDVNASMYVFKRDFLANNTTGILWDGKIDIIKMKDTAVLDIDSEEDFVLMQFIAKYLYENYPEFAQVRDNIRNV